MRPQLAVALARLGQLPSVHRRPGLGALPARRQLEHRAVVASMPPGAPARRYIETGNHSLRWLRQCGSYSNARRRWLICLSSLNATHAIESSLAAAVLEVAVAMRLASWRTGFVKGAADWLRHAGAAKVGDSTAAAVVQPGWWLVRDPGRGSNPQQTQERPQQPSPPAAALPIDLETHLSTPIQQRLSFHSC